MQSRLNRWNLLLACLVSVPGIALAEQHGQVLSNSLPVPGATVTATQGTQQFSTLTDGQGRYAFPKLPDGVWTIRVTMPLFAPLEGKVTVASGGAAPTASTAPKTTASKTSATTSATNSATNSEAAPVTTADTTWNLKMLPLAEAMPSAKVVAAVPTPQKPASDQGLLLNGSVNNAATSRFSTAAAFGNTRNHSFNLYNGDLGLVFGNSAVDARPYSLTGLDTPQPNYDEVTLIASIGGPLNIPHLWAHGPDFNAQYRWSRDSTAMAESGLVPTLAQRDDTVANPDPVASALLALYPLPNVAGNANYNYQIPVLNDSHIDAPQIRMNRRIANTGDSISGIFSLESTRSDTTNLFGFRDNTAILGMNTSLTYEHRISNTMYAHLTYTFSRARSEVTPYFENRTNIAGNAGLTGVAQDPQDWGPPTLVFSSGIDSLSDAQSAFNRQETNSLAGSLQWYLGRHNVTVGGEFRRQEYNYLSQPNPRGTFTFTGAAYGSDFADFLHGVPDTAAIVYGNPDKYLRESVANVYASDDWHLAPDLTVTYGFRWEYSAPATELKDRLANLDVSPNFSAAQTVTAQSPTGAVTSQQYPSSLLRPDRTLIEPRLAMAWRPIAGSSLLVRAGYGIYADTSVYPGIALQLAQQAPFATSISANNATCPQNLATGPTACGQNTPDTFGIDPNFRIGYAQTWNIAVQRDLPAALQLVVTYLGIAGTNGVQEFLPNTYPIGAADACPSCPTGFEYETSGGTSSRNSGTVQLRRRLRSGLTASVTYTYSKSVDDDSALGGQGPLSAGEATATAPTTTIAQNWLDLHAERSLSSFDQRHLVSGVLQYSTGMGIGGGTLMSGWLGRLYKEWTVVNTVTAGTGLPETPVYLAAVSNTGFSGSIRPNRTGASLYAAPAGRYLNPAAFTAPTSGQWGNAGRNSITGPGQLTYNASLARTFRLTSKYNLDVRVNGTNVLNHVVFTSYNTTVDPSLVSPIFGLPATPGAMRSLQFTARMRF